MRGQGLGFRVQGVGCRVYVLQLDFLSHFLSEGGTAAAFTAVPDLGLGLGFVPAGGCAHAGCCAVRDLRVQSGFSVAHFEV